tara:strand:+ start:124 stop:285 length:162 start_codon:yes stop_codon:yes gene_type:complete
MERKDKYDVSDFLTVKEVIKHREIAIQGLEAIINESNDAIAVKIAEDTLEIIN